MGIPARRYGGATLLLSAAAALMAAAFALAGCGPPPGTTTPEGVLTIVVTPTAAQSVAGLQLKSGRLQIDDLTVYGDVTPDGRSMLSEIRLDLLSAGQSFSLTMLPQGVYSRVRFTGDQVELEGSWRGVPLKVKLEQQGEGNPVDLRSNGVEVAPGGVATFAISVDVASWFAGGLLDSATATQQEILVDAANNPAVAAQLAARVAASFGLHDSPVQ